MRARSPVEGWLAVSLRWAAGLRGHSVVVAELAGGDPGIPAGAVHHQGLDPAQQRRGARDAGLLGGQPVFAVAAGQGGVLGGQHVAVPQDRPGGAPGGQPQRGRPRREIRVLPRKLPDSLRAGDIPACLTTLEDDSY